MARGSSWRIWQYLAVFGGIWRYLAVFGGLTLFLTGCSVVDQLSQTDGILLNCPCDCTVRMNLYDEVDAGSFDTHVCVPTEGAWDTTDANAWCAEACEEKPRRIACDANRRIQEDGYGCAVVDLGDAPLDPGDFAHPDTQRWYELARSGTCTGGVVEPLLTFGDESPCRYRYPGEPIGWSDADLDVYEDDPPGAVFLLDSQASEITLRNSRGRIVARDQIEGRLYISELQAGPSEARLEYIELTGHELSGVTNFWGWHLTNYRIASRNEGMMMNAPQIDIGMGRPSEISIDSDQLDVVISGHLHANTALPGVSDIPETRVGLNETAGSILGSLDWRTGTIEATIPFQAEDLDGTIEIVASTDNWQPFAEIEVVDEFMQCFDSGAPGFLEVTVRDVSGDATNLGSPVDSLRNKWSVNPGDELAYGETEHTFTFQEDSGRHHIFLTIMDENGLMDTAYVEIKPVSGRTCDTTSPDVTEVFCAVSATRSPHWFAFLVAGLGVIWIRRRRGGSDDQ